MLQFDIHMVEPHILSCLYSVLLLTLALIVLFLLDDDVFIGIVSSGNSLHITSYHSMVRRESRSTVSTDLSQVMVQSTI